MNGEAAFKVSKSEPDKVQFGWTDSLDAGSFAYIMHTNQNSSHVFPEKTV